MFSVLSIGSSVIVYIHLSIFIMWIMCFKITSDLFCTNPTTPSSVEAPRPISRYFPRVSEKLVLAAAAEELERAPPRQVPRETFFEILDWKRTSSGIRRYSSSGGKNRSILVLLKKNNFRCSPYWPYCIVWSRGGSLWIAITVPHGNPGELRWTFFLFLLLTKYSKYWTKSQIKRKDGLRTSIIWQGHVAVQFQGA